MEFTTTGVKPLILTLSMLLKKKYGRIKGNEIRHSCVGRRSEIFKWVWGLAFFSQTARFFTSLHGGDIHKINTNLILLTGPVYNASICNNANFNWKSLKSQKMQATNTFSYFSLPRLDSNHQPSDRLNSNPSI
jgi:hypothetical protein